MDSWWGKKSKRMGMLDKFFCVYTKKFAYA